MIRMKSALLSLAVAGILTLSAGCENDNKDRNMNEPKKMGQAQSNSLYSQIGGEPVLRKVVNLYFDKAMKDPQLNFAQKLSTAGQQPTQQEVDQLKNRYFTFIATAANGPQEYKGEAITTVHKDLDINTQEFARSIHLFREAMAEAGVPMKHQDELIGIMQGARSAVVDPSARPANPQ